MIKFSIGKRVPGKKSVGIRVVKEYKPLVQHIMTRFQFLGSSLSSQLIEIESTGTNPVDRELGRILELWVSQIIL